MTGPAGASNLAERAGAANEAGLTSGQAADLLGVDPRTIARWAESGRLPSSRTTGGHRRYKQADVDRLNLAILAAQRGLTVSELCSARRAATESLSRRDDRI